MPRKNTKTSVTAAGNPVASRTEYLPTWICIFYSWIGLCLWYEGNYTNAFGHFVDEIMCNKVQSGTADISVTGYSMWNLVPKPTEGPNIAYRLRFQSVNLLSLVLQPGLWTTHTYAENRYTCGHFYFTPTMWHTEGSAVLSVRSCSPVFIPLCTPL
jgi:hypothetical protein